MRPSPALAVLAAFVVAQPALAQEADQPDQPPAAEQPEAIDVEGEGERPQ